MVKQYFVKRGDRVRGPFTSGQIKRGIRSKKIRPADLLGSSDVGPWKEVRSVITAPADPNSTSNVSDSNVSELAMGASNTPSSDTFTHTVQPASLPSRDGSSDEDLSVTNFPSQASVTTRLQVPEESTFSQRKPADDKETESQDLGASAQSNAQAQFTINEHDIDATFVIAPGASQGGDTPSRVPADAQSTVRDPDKPDPNKTVNPGVTMQPPQDVLVGEFAKTLGPAHQNLYQTTPQVSLKSQLDQKGDAVQQPIAVPAAVTVRPRTIQSSDKTMVDGEPVSSIEKGSSVGDLDYVTLSKLGEGGMGTVHLARQVALGREVAVKQIHLQSNGKQSFRNEFLTEAVLTGKLEHPNIIPIHEVGELPDGDLFYSMKNVKGRSWNETIDTFSLSENLEILVDVCDAIAFAHAEGVIHRDLKPENIMTASFGEVLVLDWGLAVLTEPP